MRFIKVELGDRALEGLVASSNDALQTVIRSLVENKGESGTVTIKINIEKNTFEDGYRNLRNGLNINYKVDTAVTNKTTYSEEIPTKNMMIAESESYEYMLQAAPDPQMRVDDYFTEEDDE